MRKRCKIPTAVMTETKLPAPLPPFYPKRIANISVTVFYYPPYRSLKHFWGHIAVSVKRVDAAGENQRSPYVDTLNSVGKPTTIEQTEQEFGPSIAYQLPPPPKPLSQYDTQVSIQQHSDSFSNLSNNCTDSAVRLLSDLGYDLTIPGPISLPSRLAEKIEQNNSLAHAYQEIMQHKSDDKWDDIKTHLSMLFGQIFSEEGRLLLKPETIPPKQWYAIATGINALREKHKQHRNFTKFKQYFSCLYNFEPPASYKKLSLLLKVVNQYTNPEHQFKILTKKREKEERAMEILDNFLSAK